MTPAKATESLLPDFEVYVDGNKIPPDAQVVLYSTEVDQDIETIGMFSLLMHSGELEMEKYKWIDSDIFRLGSEVKIRIGYGSSVETLLVGEITSFSPDYPDNGAVIFRVQGYDRLHRLGFGRKTRSFRNMKDSDIASQIAQDWKLTPQVDTTDVTHEYILQNNQTDLEFLIDRARPIRYEVRVENKNLYFQKPQEGKGKIVTLTYGETLIDFFPRLTTIHHTSNVTVKGWSPKEKKKLAGEAGIGDEITKMERAQFELLWSLLKE